MTEDERNDQERHDGEDANAELLPPREALSLLNTDPAAYTGLLGDPTAMGTASPDAVPGAADTAGTATGQAHDLADAQAAADTTKAVSDQPQTVTTDTTETASSET